MYPTATAVFLQSRALRQQNFSPSLFPRPAPNSVPPPRPLLTPPHIQLYIFFITRERPSVPRNAHAPAARARRSPELTIDTAQRLRAYPGEPGALATGVRPPDPSVPSPPKGDPPMSTTAAQTQPEAKTDQDLQ